MTVWILGALLLRACLIATHPFYEPRDVVADDRLVGVYADETTGITTTISKTTARGRYRAAVKEGGSRSLYQITVFKAGRRTFADITAEKSAVVHTPGESIGPGTQLLQQATRGRHLVFAIASDKDGVEIGAPSADSLQTLWQAEPTLHRATLEQSVFVLTDATRTLRGVLERHGQGTTLFAQDLWLAKAR
jgi:hypothetical protein